MSISSPNGNDLLMTFYQLRCGTLYLVFSRFYGFSGMTCLLHVHYITVSLYYAEHGKETVTESTTYLNLDHPMRLPWKRASARAGPFASAWHPLPLYITQSDSEKLRSVT